MAEEQKTEQKRKAGRPRKNTLLWRADTVEGKIYEMASYSLSGDEIASLLGLTREALYRNADYFTAMKKGHEHCNASLRRTQYVEALKGNTTMLVWLGKQRLGQKDKTEIGGPDGKPIPITLEAAKASLVEFLSELSKRDQQPSQERVQ